MPVRATISSSLNSSDLDISIAESDVIEKVRCLLAEASQEEASKIKEMATLRENGMPLIAVGEGSVKLVFWCFELSDLERLHHWLLTGRMQENVELLFRNLLSIPHNVVLPVHVDWREENYTQGVKYMHSRTRNACWCKTEFAIR